MLLTGQLLVGQGTPVTAEAVAGFLSGVPGFGLSLVVRAIERLTVTGAYDRIVGGM